MRHKKGDTVIVVDDSRPHPAIMRHFTHWIENGQKEKIRATREYNGIQAVLLEGKVNPKMYNPELMGKCEPTYASTRFAKFDEKKEYVTVNEEKREHEHA